MRNLLAWAVGLFAASILIGCGPAKELPDEIPKSTETGSATTESREKSPEVSDPAAVEIIEHAVKAHTQNNLSLLTKGKISRMVASGTVKLPFGPGGERIHVPAQRTFLARWPDEIKFTLEFKPPNSGTRTLILRGPFTWTGMNGVQDPNLNPEKIKNDMRADAFGLHWLVLLFPISEQKTVVFDPRKGSGVGKPAADVVKVAIPGLPIYRLHVAPDTGFITQIDYHYTDMLGPTLTEWMISDPKEFGGLLLPTHLKMARTTERPKFRDLVEEWSVEKWEFPEKLDDNAFDAPK